MIKHQTNNYKNYTQYGHSTFLVDFQMIIQIFYQMIFHQMIFHQMIGYQIFLMVILEVMW